MEALLHPSIPNLPIFFTVYLLLYLLAYFFIFRQWATKLRPEASSCVISLAHGTPAVILASWAILSDPIRDFHSPNTPFQSLVLDYSIAYFTMDLCHYLVFYPTDVLFIGHHLATLFVFITCRYLVFHGAFAIMVLLILAEVTSLCQNVWTLAGARRADSGFAARVYEVLSPPFYVLYTLVRGFVGPYFVYRMLGFYLAGLADRVIPRWVWVSWVCVVFTAICVSILWISNLWIELFRERNSKLHARKKIE
ncbi:OLC1v1011781C1 [Oldenlandia corymbosa var. corymbosa]|uniref:OLC1v1011781C1 n=1 Tax=Oldenlandia corymbosa var. corymbosa TaxID=529605 RepID=A0AAV1DUI1_OLDCO|nr:OLC1v1011781C1 [Oldenlandia corymbosa var. corymbosa]